MVKGRSANATLVLRPVLGYGRNPRWEFSIDKAGRPVVYQPQVIINGVAFNDGAPRPAVSGAFRNQVACERAGREFAEQHGYKIGKVVLSREVRTVYFQDW